jgi:hypothetical protein
MPKLVRADAAATPAEYVVGAEPLTIGRSSECAVSLLDLDVGRLHAVVERRNGSLVIRDQSSRGGTFVNGTRVGEKELGEGDTVKIGGASFTVKLADSPAVASTRTSRRGADGEAGEIRARGRQKREVLGGARMSKSTQTIVKIVCAGISAMSLFGMAWILAGRKPSAPINIERKIHVDPMAEPKALEEEAHKLAQLGKDAEQQGKTSDALAQYLAAKAKIEQATAILEELARTHEGKGYGWVQDKASSLNTQAQGIRTELFRIQMQIMREQAGHR